jgi:hypothetical protein
MYRHVRIQDELRITFEGAGLRTASSRLFHQGEAMAKLFRESDLDWFWR